MSKSFVADRFFAKILVAVFTLFFVSSGFAQTVGLSGGELYTYLKTFQLTGGTSDVSGLVLRHDRGVMTFNGTFYFAAPVEGRVTGAVFIGQGTFRAEIPPSDFEKNNVKRMLNAEAVESDFKTAVLRFTDDTFETIGKNSRAGGAAPAQAQKLAAEIDARMMRETGANLSARLALALFNAEKPGFFFANFEGGKLGRFSYLYDPQTRIPTANFDINAGERGLIFSYQPDTNGNDVWMAFYGLDDYKNGRVSYSDANDLVDIAHYKMDVDLRAPKTRLGLQTTVTLTPRLPNLRAIPFFIGEGLGEYDGQRLKKQMRVKSVKLDGQPLALVQEDWESGFLVLLPKYFQPGQKLDLAFEIEGDFLRQPELIDNCHYPRSNTTWYPRHGFLDRSTYDFAFRHHKNLKVASVGSRQSEAPDAENKEMIVTKYSMKHPIALATFALGPFERHAETIKWDNGDAPTPIEFNSLPGSYIAIKEDFILAELNNSVRFFHELFGKYPYENFSASFHPFAFGQGFPSMLMIPKSDRASKFTYSFISHETAHQWWGNIVSWRSYRDQWLSEGFAEYSGVLYTSFRQDPKAAKNLVDGMRDSLKNPPRTLQGIGKGKLVDVGPIILGLRLNTSKTNQAYQSLIYDKGALVLRMVHFLMTNPADGDDKAFFAMMKDFVETFRNQAASTDDFRIIAGEHFAKTPIAQKYGLTNLDWFFDQWVYQTNLPSFKLEYAVQNQPDGTFLVTGSVLQENAGEKWFMPLPVVFTFGDKKIASGTFAAYGAKTPFSIKLPMKPVKVELDPHRWVLSEKTS